MNATNDCSILEKKSHTSRRPSRANLAYGRKCPICFLEFTVLKTSIAEINQHILRCSHNQSRLLKRKKNSCNLKKTSSLANLIPIPSESSYDANLPFGSKSKADRNQRKGLVKQPESNSLTYLQELTKQLPTPPRKEIKRFPQELEFMLKELLIQRMIMEDLM